MTNSKNTNSCSDHPELTIADIKAQIHALRMQQTQLYEDLDGRITDELLAISRKLDSLVVLYTRRTIRPRPKLTRSLQPQID